MKPNEKSIFHRPIVVSENDKSLYGNYTLPANNNDSEATVFIVEPFAGGLIEPKRPVEYRFVSYVQIGTERKSIAPGEHVIFKLQPGTHKIKAVGVCGRSNETPLIKGSTITPDTAGWYKVVDEGSNSMLTNYNKELIAERGKVYIGFFSSDCALDGHYVGGVRLVDDQNARYLVFKTKLAN